jgi:alanyl-tRNA synthetase
VLGGGDGTTAQLVAACSAGAVARGVTAPALLEQAASVIGGGAGGKDVLAMAGGRRADAVAEALTGIPGRLAELLGA